MSLISVNDITMQFGGLRALHDVSFTLEAGEILGLIGPNGAGRRPSSMLSRGHSLHRRGP